MNRLACAFAALTLLLAAGGTAAAQDSGGWTWKHEASGGSYFGTSVALDGDLAFVGEPGVEVEGVASAGQVHVYQRGTDGGWAPVDVLTLADKQSGDFFGMSLAHADGHLVVGGTGRGEGFVTVWDGTGGTYQRVATLTGDEGEGSNTFGWTVAFDGQTVVVGSPYVNIDGKRGRAYVFYRTHGAESWARVAKLVGSELGNMSEFGASVAVDGDLVVVGDFRDDDSVGPTYGPGAAYVFARDQGGTDAWGETAVLRADGVTANISFGQSVDVAGGVAAIGAPSEAGGGAVRLFEQDAGGAWEPLITLSPTDGAAGDNFGRTVRLDGPTRLFASARRGALGGMELPGVYVYDRVEAVQVYDEVGRIYPFTTVSDGWGSRLGVDGDHAVLGGQSLGQATFYAREDPCEPNPCAHGGTCTPLYEYASFECACPSGWTGPTCEAIACAPACAHGGTCIEQPSCGRICECSGGYRPPDCTTKCGDGTCDAVESCSDCPQDCQPCDMCGDGVCRPEYEEDEVSCPDDCAADSGGLCGDGFCDAGEDEFVCPSDCPGGGGFCGDGFCDAGEEFACIADCSFGGGGGTTDCGDGVCGFGEGCDTCVADCGFCDYCGDGFCQEDCGSCPADCGPCDDPCAGEPCQNGGTCIGDCETYTYTCDCPEGWTGDTCSQPVSQEPPVVAGTSPAVEADVCGDGTGVEGVVTSEEDADGVVVQVLVEDPDTAAPEVYLVLQRDCGISLTNQGPPPHQQLTGVSPPDALHVQWPGTAGQPSAACDPCDLDGVHEPSECDTLLVPMDASDGTAADSLRYTPYHEEGWEQFGLDEVLVAAFDGSHWSAAVTVPVYVAPVRDDAPVAGPDVLTADEAALVDGGGAFTVSGARLLDGGGFSDQADFDLDVSGGSPRGWTDPCGSTDSFSIAEVSLVTGGHLAEVSVVEGPAGTPVVRVVPEAGYTTPEGGEPGAFEYRLVDESGLYSAPARVEVPVPAVCDPGFVPAAGGAGCEQAVDDCADSPCVHGTCADPGPTFECACEDGWVGPTCAVRPGCASCSGERSVPDDPRLADQGWLERVGAPWAWAVTTGAPDVKVGLVSTGLDTTHPDAPAGVRFDLSLAWYAGTATSFDGTDSIGEGTYLAGLVAAPHDNGAGGAGLAPGVEIVALKVFGTGSGFQAEYAAEAIDHAVSSGVQVIAVPFRLDKDLPAVRTAVEAAVAAGALVVAPAGGFPAAYDGVLAVGSLREDGSVGHAWEQSPDVVAPFGGLSTLPGDGYGPVASPSGPVGVAAGVAALAWSAHPQPRGDVIRDLLMATAEDLGPEGFDPESGAGVVRADAAVAVAAGCGTCAGHSDPCAPDPCVNGGQCARHDDLAGQACFCPPGFTGLRCERDLGPCGAEGPADVQRMPDGALRVGAPLAWGRTRGEGVTIGVVAPDTPGVVDMLASIVSAPDSAAGTVGVAPDAALAISTFTPGDAAGAAAALDAVTAQGVAVAVLATSLDTDDATLHQAVIDARAANVLVVVPSSATPGEDWPAAWPEVLSVGALDLHDALLPDSGAGDVVAPGVTRASLGPDGGVEATVSWGEHTQPAQWVAGSDADLSVTGRLYDCGPAAAPTDCPEEVAGHVAHVRRTDGLTVEDQVVAAVEAGAVAVIVSHDGPGLLTGVMEPLPASPIPGVASPALAVTVSRAAGDALVEAAADGPWITVDVTTSDHATVVGADVAAAHAAGVAALARAADYTLSVGAIEKLLKDTAHDLGDPGVDAVFGAGLVRADAAVAGLAACPGGAVEVCDGADNDCDGEVDEDFGVWLDPTDPAGGRAACAGTAGVCGAFAGTVECAGPEATRCSVDAGGSEARATCEVCDQDDDDCDGAVDEDTAPETCGEPEDPCASSPCEAGTCERLGWDAWRCLCPEGLGGPTCGVDLDPCAAAPCDNGGTCSSTWYGFTCDCPHPWAGDTCTVQKQPCDQAAGTGGCADEAVEACVCAVAPGCCKTKWSASCAGLAGTTCVEAAEPPPVGQASLDCVCSYAPACCEPGGWKPACQELAADKCATGGDCLTAHVTRGCSDATLQGCVCAEVPLCCMLSWSDVCVEQAGKCVAGSKPPVLGTGEALLGPCDEPHGGVGCIDPDVTACVCDRAPHCCTTEWDDLCAKTATLACADPVSRPPACTDAKCPPDEDRVACVCDLVPKCCTTWTAACQDQYDGACAPTLKPPPDDEQPPPVGDDTPDPPTSDAPDKAKGGCCEEHASTGCDEPVTEQCVCAHRPECCEVGWSARCAILAWDACGSFCSPTAPEPTLPTLGSDPGPLPDPGDLTPDDPCYAAVSSITPEDCTSVAWHQQLEEDKLLAQAGTPVLCLQERIEACIEPLAEAGEAAFDELAAGGPVQLDTVIRDFDGPEDFADARVLAVLAPSADATSTQEPYVDHFDDWGADEAIASCDEYVWQWLYDYRLWQDRTAGKSDHYAWIAAYVGAMDDGTIGRRGKDDPDHVIRSLSEFPDVYVSQDDPRQTDLGWEMGAPKNAFFSIHGGALEALFGNDMGLYSKVATADATRYQRSDGWEFHDHMGTTLITNGPWKASDLAWFDGIEEAFRDLLQRRARLHNERLRRTRHGEPTADLEARIDAMDQQIVDHLQFADALGCLEPHAIGPCDWSPADFVREVDRYYGQVAETERDRCERFTGGDFSNLSWVKPNGAYTGIVEIDGDPTESDTTFRLYLRDLEESLDLVVSDIAANADRLKMADTDLFPEKGFGNDYFGLFMRWEAGYGVTQPALDLETGDCTFGAEARSSFAITATLFGVEDDLFAVDYSADVEARYAFATVDVLGEAWMGGQQTSDGQPHLPLNIVVKPTNPADTVYTQTFFEYDEWVPVFFVPIHVFASVVGQIGADLDVTAVHRGFTRNSPGDFTCHGDFEIGIRGHVTPWAGLSAHASAGVGVPGFEAGVRGDLNLLRGSLPFTLDLGAGPEDALSALDLDVTARLQRKLEVLSGRLYAYLDYPCNWGIDTCTSKDYLFDWKGWTRTDNLFHHYASLPVGAIAAVCDAVAVLPSDVLDCSAYQ